MENLTPEQARELNEIAKLPHEQQQIKLQEFLSTLSEEQLEYLKKQQEQGCPFCSIVFGEVTANKLYEDNKVMAVLDINPGNKGHFITFLKEHVRTSFDIKQEDFMYLMNVTNLLAKRMQSLVKADGFNILLSNGGVAGQRGDHFLVHAIPRFKDDGINLRWDVKKIDENFNRKILQDFNSFVISERKAQVKERKYYQEEERIP